MDRFISLWNRWSGSPPPSAALDANWDSLSRRYSEPHRAYHNLDHIHDCLARFDEYAAYAVRPEAASHPALDGQAWDDVEMAIWYHDVVYDPRHPDNEHQSCVLFREHAAGLAAQERIDRVAATIMATQAHVSSSTAEALMLDIDLSILGQPEDRFAEYDDAIRKEYGHVSESDYRAGRSKVLRSFLARPRIFVLGYFQDRYEQTARSNLQAALDCLDTATESS
ncbi:uncharacterized protein BJ171DRAFT_128455 [Polychytrium aggregatum]|uniref:uncharacterized protein n=1 Tax=Polychytrium aggregatum TaxID=110093 RepID=UPI0022FEE5FA|nr:uncharacterized protein BJ171DRAFT_128455 [Polychytrium aggregatum]KAI9204077.1 hypothetical protein BJ171DRAFT_128455 [Polychytrium aggregatum]